MCKGVITFKYKQRFVDRITALLYKMNLYRVDGYYPIFEDDTNDEIAAFVCVRGYTPIVKFLGLVTQFRGKNTTEVIINY